VARIVTRCLEKEPERRFASTDDLVAALEATARPAGTPTGARSVAVLPFRELAARSAEGGELGLGITTRS
jgi:hypothetical protein